MRKLNENIAFAKSVLKKQNILPDTEDYKDYLRIRELCGDNHGYVGILTKLRFIDDVKDFNELKSIFDLLKNSKIDFAKMLKLSYQDILEIFYEELSGEKDNKKDLELVFKDNQYTYYRVYTYEGILKIGSPAWCLKTKAHWVDYHSKYPDQWVAIDNRYVRGIITPDNSYLSEYKSKSGWIRYGVSINWDASRFVGFSDDNFSTIINPSSYTFFGVFSTIRNLKNGIKKSYYENFTGCELVDGYKIWQKVRDPQLVLAKLFLEEEDKNNNIKPFFQGSPFQIWIKFSTTYSFYPVMIILNDNRPVTAIPVNLDSKSESNQMDFSILSGVEPLRIIEEYAIQSDNNIWSGLKLRLGKITLEDIKKNNKYLGMFEKWIIYDRNDDFYLVVNSNPPKEIELGRAYYNGRNFNMPNPLYFYVEKKTNNVFYSDVKDVYGPVVDFIKRGFKDKNVKGFFDFLK